MQIRKMFTVVEDTRSEGGIDAEPPLRKVAAVAVLKNPFAGRYEPDLQPLTDASAAIGREMTERAMEVMMPFDAVSYGKAGIVGIGGEQEHCVALLTTVFGNVLREAAGGGKAWISSMTKRAAPGSLIDVPLAHKDALYVRSHYDGMTLFLPDSPLPDEIAIICCYANRGRLNHRVGGLEAAAMKGEDGLT